MQNPKTSIIILDFLKSKRVLQNVEGLLNQKKNFEMEIIIIDNSCSEENAKKLRNLAKHPNIQIYINQTNRGYIRGINQGVRLAKGEYVVILNPDIICREEGTLQKLVDYMEHHPQVGVCGPKQIDENTSETAMTVRAFPKFHLQVARRTFLRNLPVIQRQVKYDEMQHLDYFKIQEVDWLQSSFWVTRKKLWDQMGGLNDDYYIFMSDPDFCRKVWEKGYKVVFLPNVRVYADGIRCSEGGVVDYFKKWTIRQHVKDSLKYTLNYLNKPNPRSTN